MTPSALAPMWVLTLTALSLLVGCGDTDSALPSTSPPEVLCDGLDDDDDGVVDDGLLGAPLSQFLDQDGDGYGTAEGSLSYGCLLPGYILTGGDCDDTNIAISPAAEEACDQIDNDCDGEVDDHSLGALASQYPDGDGDGYGRDEDRITHGCALPGYALFGGDCDDGDAAISPVGQESCDQVDNDCDGDVDEGLLGDLLLQYPDGDGDGFGRSEDYLRYGCPLPGFVSKRGDCDDQDPAISPAAEDLCDKVDNNCDGEIDEDFASSPYTQYRDADGDSYGSPADALRDSCPLAGYIWRAGDCDDTRDDIYPGQPDLCDGLDNDCNGIVDDPSFRYLDLDQDGWGTAEVSETGCAATGPYWVERDGDCDDLDPFSYPGAAEVCDGNDHDCDGNAWEGSPGHLWYADRDGDGLGDPTSGFSCSPAAATAVVLPNDCDDHNPDPAHGAVAVQTRHRDTGTTTSVYRYDRPDCANDPRFFSDSIPIENPTETRTTRDSDGATLWLSRFTYDAQCNLLTQTNDAGGDGILDAIQRWEYSDLAKPTLYTLDRDNDGLVDATTRWTYDEAGTLLLTEDDPDGDGLFETTYRYTCTWTDEGHTETCITRSEDDYLRIVHTWGEDGTLLYHFDGSRGYTYDEDGKLILLDGSAGLSEYIYDAEGHLLEISGERTHTTYTYDERGNKTSMQVVDNNDEAVLEEQVWTYDDVDRLISWSYYEDWLPSTYTAETRTYDEEGSAHVHGTVDYLASGERYDNEYWAELDPNGRLRYNSTRYYDPDQPVEWGAWYDENNQQTESFLRIPTTGLDATFPVYHPIRGPGAVEYNGLILVQRNNSGWRHLYPGLNDTQAQELHGIDTWSWEGNYFANGAPRSEYNIITWWESYRTSWFMNGLIRSQTHVMDESLGHETHTSATLAHDTYTYRKTECEQLTTDYGYEYEECSTFTATFEWSCPE